MSETKQKNKEVKPSEGIDIDVKQIIDIELNEGRQELENLLTQIRKKSQEIEKIELSLKQNIEKIKEKEQEKENLNISIEFMDQQKKEMESIQNQIDFNKNQLISLKN